MAREGNVCWGAVFDEHGFALPEDGFAGAFWDFGEVNLDGGEGFDIPRRRHGAQERHSGKNSTDSPEGDGDLGKKGAALGVELLFWVGFGRVWCAHDIRFIIVGVFYGRFCFSAMGCSACVMLFCARAAVKFSCLRCWLLLLRARGR